jgi:hypothetical protein
LLGRSRGGTGKQGGSEEEADKDETFHCRAEWAARSKRGDVERAAVGRRGEDGGVKNGIASRRGL